MIRPTPRDLWSRGIDLYFCALGRTASTLIDHYMVSIPFASHFVRQSADSLR